MVIENLEGTCMSYVCIVSFIQVRFIRKIVFSLQICCAIKESNKNEKPV